MIVEQIIMKASENREHDFVKIEGYKFAHQTRQIGEWKNVRCKMHTGHHNYMVSMIPLKQW